MKLKIILNSKIYSIDLKSPLDISIPLQFYADNPAFWGVSHARSSTYTVEGFIGDTRLGGSCNIEEYYCVPHCQGTHTECVGHISHQKIYLNKILQDAFIPSTLITINPQLGSETEDKYIPFKSKNDLIISQQALIENLVGANPDFLIGLIIRTLPNDDSKKLRDYMIQLPCFFSLDAIKYVVNLGVKHLLVDMPSVDKVFDEGQLSVHRTFWNVPLGEHNIDPDTCSLNTISEMIYVPSEIVDGLYLLNLQIPAFATDAAPSRPLLYRILFDS